MHGFLRTFLYVFLAVAFACIGFFVAATYCGPEDKPIAPPPPLLAVPQITIERDHRYTTLTEQQIQDLVEKQMLEQMKRYNIDPDEANEEEVIIDDNGYYDDKPFPVSGGG